VAHPDLLLKPVAVSVPASSCQLGIPIDRERRSGMMPNAIPG
jgi:hypothetical protein